MEEIKIFLDKGLTEEAWLSLLGYHPIFHNFNRFPTDIEKLKSSFVLSGKKDGYPLHLWIFGPAGTKKTVGHIETLASQLGHIVVAATSARNPLHQSLFSFHWIIPLYLP